MRKCLPAAAFHAPVFDRRTLLNLMLGGICGAGTAAARPVIQDAPKAAGAARNDGPRPALAPPPTPDAELAEARDRLERAGISPLNVVRSAHYVAVGDAPEPFMRVILGDCEQLAADFLRFFSGLGFRVQLPQRPLLVIMFRDDRSFGRFFHLPSLLEAAAKGRPVQPAGIYDRSTNVLHVFDWRNVPMEPRLAPQHGNAGPRGNSPAFVQYGIAEPPGRHAPVPHRGPWHIRRAEENPWAQ